MDDCVYPTQNYFKYLKILQNPFNVYNAVLTETNNKCAINIISQIPRKTFSHFMKKASDVLGISQIP